jgi:hypothetical protein
MERIQPSRTFMQSRVWEQSCEMAQSCGTHPETALRLKFLDIFDHSLPNEDQIAFRGDFIKIIDSVWMKLREW